jgi:hypothetical protein
VGEAGARQNYLPDSFEHPLETQAMRSGVLHRLNALEQLELDDVSTLAWPN